MLLKITSALFLASLLLIDFSQHIVYANDDDITESSEPNALTTDKTNTNPLNSQLLFYNVSDDDYDDEVNTCTTREFINGLNCSQFLPDDYEQVKSEEIKIDVESINDTFALVDRLQNWALKLYNNKDLVDTAKLIGSRLSDSMYEANLPPDCMAAFAKIASAIQNRKIWAAKFFDSFGNLVPSGLAGGRIASLGEYDECVSIESEPDNGTILYGQYCQLRFIIPHPKRESYRPENEFFVSEQFMPGIGAMVKQMDVDPSMLDTKLVYKAVEGMEILKGTIYKHGICIPHVCQPKDIENAINKVMYPLLKIPVTVPELMCQSKVKTRPVDDHQKVSLIIFSTLIALVILSTAYETIKIYFPKSQNFYDPNDNAITVTEHKSRDTLEKIALAFSAITNTKKLLEVPHFPAVYSIRMFLMFGYFSLMAFVFPLAPMIQRYLIGSVPFHLTHYGRYFFVRTPILWIDGLVCCFGLLTTYNILEKLKKTNGAFNFGSFLWQRWIRVVIPLAGSILIIYLVPLSGDGPVWNNQMLVFQQACRKPTSLIATLFNFNNYMFEIMNYKLELACPVCNPISWYFSTTFQLYFFTPIIFLSLYKWPKYGVILTIGLVIIGTFTTLFPKFIFGYYNYHNIRVFENVRQTLIHNTPYYLSPLQYVAPFSSGSLVGYLLRKKPNINIGGKRVELLLWLIAVSIIPGIYVWNNSFWSLKDAPSEVSVLLWYSVGRTLWSLAFAWIYFACSTGRGGIFARFLSIRALQPIGKLSYTVYILQVPVLINRIYRTRDSYIMTDSQLFQDMYVDITKISIFAFVFYIILERPLLNLVDLMSSKNNWSEYDNSEMYGISEYYKKNITLDQINSSDKKHVENGANNAATNTSDSSENSSINANNGYNDTVNIIK